MTNRREFIKTLLLGSTALVIERRLLPGYLTNPPSAICHPQSNDGWAQVPEILKRIKAPVFPRRDFDITRFGAVADGKTDCTEAFQNAIAACNKAGGGRVVVPAGTFLTGAIHLKSNVNLQIVEGATLRFTPDPVKYLPVVFTRWEGVECMNYSPLIYAFEQENIAVTGGGILDGSASVETWWGWNRRVPGQSTKQLSSRNQLFAQGERGVPVKERRYGSGHYLRPNFIQPYRCRNVLIDGITINNSPMWEIHPVLCTNVTVRGVKIISHGPNNDGCNPESCRDVLIEGCYFDTGDDCIAIKSGRNNDGRRVNVPSENIIVRRCQMKDGHGGVTIGSEISGGVRNVFAEDCRMDSPNLDRALRIKTNSVRGGVLENIFARRVTIGQVSESILSIDFNYEEGDAGQHTPTVRNIELNEITSQKSKYVFFLKGYKRAPISDIRVINCSFENVEQAHVIENVQNLMLRGVKINGVAVGN